MGRLFGSTVAPPSACESTFTDMQESRCGIDHNPARWCCGTHWHTMHLPLTCGADPDKYIACNQNEQQIRLHHRIPDMLPSFESCLLCLFERSAEASTLLQSIWLLCPNALGRPTQDSCLPEQTGSTHLVASATNNQASPCRTQKPITHVQAATCHISEFYLTQARLPYLDS